MGILFGFVRSCLLRVRWWFWGFFYLFSEYFLFWVFWWIYEDNHEDVKEVEGRRWRKVFFARFLVLVPLRILFFWLWSLYKFRFLILLPLNVWLINKFAMSDTATSSSVCHMCIFVTEVDGRDENQKVINLQGLF